MNAPRFWRHAGIALLISIAGAVGHSLLWPVLGASDAARLLLLGAGSAYLLATMLDNGGPGRLVFAAGWIGVAMVLLLMNPPLLFWLLAALAAIWLQRCLLRHRGPLAAAIDAALCATSAMAAIWTLQYSRNLWLALWVFFLLQALHMFLPGAAAVASGATGQRFDAARRAAEAALRRISPHA
jgi:hypothetical protein